MYDYIAISLLIGSFFIMLLLRVPIAFALGLSAIFTIVYLGLPLEQVLVKLVAGLRSTSLLSIPFFILAGEIMGQGGISRRLIALSNVIVGRFRGGLSHVNILTSMFFGGISGSAVADTSSVGSVMIPMMKKANYDEDYAVAVTITSATQGVIIPPSHNMIIYSTAAGGLSVGALFMAGLIPGIMLGLAIMVLSVVIAIKRNYPKGSKVSLKAGIKIFTSSILGLLTAVIIVVGVLGGVMTATEAAAVAAVYAFIVTFFVYREIKLKQFNKILNATLKTLGIVMSVIATSTAFAFCITYLRVPELVTDVILNISSNKIVILILINVILLILGMIMDMAPLILIATPILLPVATQVGMDQIQFGIVLMLNLGIGLITPPVGTSLFVGSSIGKISVEQTVKALWPFYIVMVVVLLLLTFVPQISMFLPTILGLV